MVVIFFSLLIHFLAAEEGYSEAQRVKIMTYNVENLFDEIHDPGKDDWAFLPLTSKASKSHKKRCLRLVGKRQRECASLDWSHAEVESKLDRLSRVIKMPFGELGPDILVLAEVENLAIAERLRALLPLAKYRKALLIEGRDPRGIDVAVLSRFPLGSPPELHRKLKGLPRVRLSRGILEAPFRLDSGIILRLFAVHFPAPYHTREQRIGAFYFLNLLAKSTRNPQSIEVAAGDFNVPRDEGNLFYKAVMNPTWIISHLVDCGGCLGTYYFAKGKAWSFLDAIMIRRGSGGVFCGFVSGSVRVIDTSNQGFKAPSDHQPLIAELNCGNREIRKF